MWATMFINTRAVAWIIVDANAMHGNDLRPDLRTIYAAIHDHCNIINGTYLTDFISWATRSISTIWYTITYNIIYTLVDLQQFGVELLDDKPSRDHTAHKYTEINTFYPSRANIGTYICCLWYMPTHIDLLNAHTELCSRPSLATRQLFAHRWVNGITLALYRNKKKKNFQGSKWKSNLHRKLYDAQTNWIN